MSVLKPDGWRRSHAALFLLAVGVALLLAAALHASVDAAGQEKRAAAELAAELGLTDIALFTEARYTRHPSQADLATPFQDHPMSFDHFPSGSLVPPNRNFPAAVMRGGTADGMPEDKTK